jgi:hypothetical protein
MENIIVNFLNEPCSVRFHRYANRTTAIQLTCRNGEPMTIATANLPEINTEPEYVVVKDYSENEGVAEALEAAGVVEKVDLYLLPPFASRVWLCRLLKYPAGWLE